MDEKELKRFKAKARARAIKSRLAHEADDFESYSVLKRIQGCKSTVDRLWIDYLRENYGDNRSKYRQNQMRLDPKPLSENIPAPVETARDLNFAFIQRFLSNDTDGSWFSQRDRTIMTLVYQWGFSQTEIADTLGVDLSRVTRILQEIEARIRAFLTHEMDILE